MADELQDESLIRMYLLNELPEADLERVELRMLQDPKFYERVALAEDDLADEYVEGQLSGEEQRKFEQFFMTTVDRQEQVQLSIALSRHISAREEEPTLANSHVVRTNEAVDRKRIVRRAWAQARGWCLTVARLHYVGWAAAVIVLAVAVALWLVTRPSPLRTGAEALQAAYRQQRPLEERISHLPYAPWSERLGSEPDRIDYVSLKRAEILLVGEAVDHPSSKSHHELARLYLAEQEFDKAIDQLNQALKDDPTSSRLHSDLGVALLEQGRAELQKDEPAKAFDQLSKSLNHLNRAIELDSSLLEPNFNRGLCYEYLSQPEAAEAAWKNYLTKDSNSKWAEEAREHLTKIEERRKRLSLGPAQLFAEFTDSFNTHDSARGAEALSQADSGGRNLIVGRLLDKYLDVNAKRLKRDAAEVLSLLRFAGQFPVADSGRSPDRFLSDLVAFYGAAKPAKLALLAEARSHLKAADDSFEQSRPEALDRYQEAELLFKRLGDRCEFVSARYRVATCNLRSVSFESALEALRPLAKICDVNGYLGMHAWVLTSMAYAAYGLNRYSEGIGYSHAALQLAESIGDRPCVIRCCAQLAQAYQQLGDSQTSFSFVLWGLRQADVPPWSARHRSQIYDAAADACTLAGLYDSALGYQIESMQIDLATGNTLATSRGYAYLGMIHAKLGHFNEALRNVQQSIDVGHRVADEAVRRDIEAFGSLRLGSLYRQSGDFPKAIECYSRNLNVYPAMAPESYAAHKGRMCCYIALGDDRSAEAELQTVLTLFERFRANVLEERSKNIFFDKEQDTYDLAVNFAYSRLNDSSRAFEYAEASRARALLDSTRPEARVRESGGRPELELPADEHPLRLPDIQAKLRPDIQVLQYSVLEDKVLMWVISKESAQSREKKISCEALSTSVTTFVEGLHHPPDDESIQTNALAQELYRVLIQPVESSLSPAKCICIIPDKYLNYLPFQALISPASGEYLIKRYRLLVCPSSTIFVKSCLAAAAKERSGPEKLLAVGNPSFDRGAYRMADLFTTGREVEDIARFYRPARVITGSRARKIEIQEYMRRADVIHLATHYVVDERSPLLSRLLLAKEPEGGGVLQAQEIYKLKPLRARLVVLAGCQTLADLFYKGEGAVGAARPFISAGVPLVVASLWPVDSSATESLMVSFHRHRKLESLSTAAALRQAQLEMISSSTARFRDPYYWAAFTLIGGYAAF